MNNFWTIKFEKIQKCQEVPTYTSQDTSSIYEIYEGYRTLFTFTKYRTSYSNGKHEQFLGNLFNELILKTNQLTRIEKQHLIKNKWNRLL